MASGLLLPEPLMDIPSVKTGQQLYTRSTGMHQGRIHSMITATVLCAEWVMLLRPLLSDTPAPANQICRRHGWPMMYWGAWVGHDVLGCMGGP